MVSYETSGVFRRDMSSTTNAFCVIDLRGDGIKSVCKPVWIRVEFQESHEACGHSFSAALYVAYLS